jgi:hypothetical protein
MSAQVSKDGFTQDELEALLMRAAYFTPSGIGKNDVVGEVNARNTDLSNRYALVRNYLEKRYTGRELEERLEWLSQAFDSAAEKIASRGASRLKTLLENATITEEYHDLVSLATYDNIKEAFLTFAHLTKQFVLENGTVRTEQDEVRLTSFLNKAERPEGSLTFEDLLTLNNLVYEEDEPEEQRSTASAAMAIARRIANGDNVPPQDHQLLYEFDRNLYNDSVRKGMWSENDNPIYFDSIADKFNALFNAEPKERDELGELEEYLEARLVAAGL